MLSRKESSSNSNNKVSERLLLFSGDAEDILDYRNGYIKEGTVDCIFTDPPPPNNVTDINKLCRIFDKAKRVLKPTGSICVVMTDYHDEKGSLELFPDMFAYQMKQRHRWIVRSRIVCQRPEPLEEMLAKREDTNRFYRDYDFILWFTQGRYGYHFDGYRFNKDTGRLRGCIIPSTCSFRLDDIHPGEFATRFPKNEIKYILPIICPPGGVVMDTHAGTGTTGLVALQLGYRFIGIDKNEKRIPMMQERLSKVSV